MRSVGFTLDGQCGEARAGTLNLEKGQVKTPVFMPVGTQGAVWSVSPLHLKETPTQIVLANTYHLSQRLGERWSQRPEACMPSWGWICPS